MFVGPYECVVIVANLTWARGAARQPARRASCFLNVPPRTRVLQCAKQPAAAASGQPASYSSTQVPKVLDCGVVSFIEIHYH